MSFFRIEDPRKRDAAIAEYMTAVKRIKDHDLQERMGSLQNQEEIQKSFKAIMILYFVIMLPLLERFSCQRFHGTCHVYYPTIKKDYH